MIEPPSILLSSHALFPSRRSSSSSRCSSSRRGRAQVYCVFFRLWNGEGAWALTRARRESRFVTVVDFMPYYSIVTP